MSLGPDDWKTAAQAAWAVLLLPIGMVWKKANGAVQKEDFTKAVDAFALSLKEHAQQDRETHEAIFRKLDEMVENQGDIKAAAARVEATLSFIRPQR